jgi:hypothetical protein
MTGRAEAQVMRLAMLFALADCATVITADHLRAALDVWQYCFDSARFIFGESFGDRVTDDLLAALREAGEPGLARADMSRDVFGRNRPSREIGEALERLREHGLARGQRESSGVGRPVERWFATN